MPKPQKQSNSTLVGQATLSREGSASYLGTGSRSAATVLHPNMHLPGEEAVSAMDNLSFLWLQFNLSEGPYTLRTLVPTPIPGRFIEPKSRTRQIQNTWTFRRKFRNRPDFALVLRSASRLAVQEHARQQLIVCQDQYTQKWRKLL